MTITYTAALAVGLLVFTALSLVTIDRALKSTLDARLARTLQGFARTAARRDLSSHLDQAIDQQLINDLNIQQNGAVIASDGTITMRSASVPVAVLGFARSVSGANPTYATVAGDGGLRVAAMLLPGRKPATLVIWRPLDVIADYERVALTILVASALVIIVLAFVAGSLIVNRGLRPLRAMAAIASEIEARDLTRRLSNALWDEELQNVATTFDRMLDRLQVAFQSQRQFTADASHDLRAPLAVMRAEVDLALARLGNAEDDKRTFLSIRDEILEFDRLLDALLLAARADTGPLNATEVDVVRLASRASDRLDPFAISRCVTIANEVVRAPAIVGDADLLERVLMSLLHNGIKFSPSNGTVYVSTRHSASTISLVVRDEGPGFSEDALKFACDRFWKDDTARGRSGTGLGLAIAKSAVERIGGSIVVQNSFRGGAEVEVIFPVTGGLV